MPSFYPRSAGRQQHPLTPPEYQPYSASGYGAMHYQPSSYAALPVPTYKSEATYEYPERRTHALAYQPSLPSMVYQPAPAFTNSGLSATQQYFDAKMAPILPPLVPSQPPAYTHTLAADLAFRPLQEPAHQKAPPAKAEKPVGGVALQLDYDMDTMADFVAEMTHGIVQSNTQHVDSSFRKWVNQVLCATRLPSATILLSLQYLQIRMTQTPESERYAVPDQRQRMLTTALILGSKFCDDNTFINRSWSEVSGIEVKILNLMEIQWFQAMDHRLHRDTHESSGWWTWHKHWTEFEREHKARRTADNLKLSPIDTSMAYKSPRPAWSSSALASAKPAYNARSQGQYEPMQYDTPTYTPYDNAWYPRSATNHSPASAPHTGPTTPEYYAANGTAAAAWYTGNEGYSRRTMFGIPASQAPMAQPAQAPYQAPAHYAAYPAVPQLPQLGMPYMNGHPYGCLCYQCAKSPTNYYLTHHPFGQAMSVAG